MGECVGSKKFQNLVRLGRKKFQVIRVLYVHFSQVLRSRNYYKENGILSTEAEKLYMFYNQDVNDSNVPSRAFNNIESRSTVNKLKTNGHSNDLQAMSLANLHIIEDEVGDMNTIRQDDGESSSTISNIQAAQNQAEPCFEQPSNDFNPHYNRQGDSVSVINSLYFLDGIRSVDFVLVWKNPSREELHLEDMKQKKRNIFEQNLLRDGLQLETETIEGEIHFIKIHAPLEVLRRYSEILKLRMPMKEIPGMAGFKVRTTSVLSRLKGIGGKIARRILVEEKYFPPRSQRFTAVYSRDKEYLFDHKQARFFTAAIRSRIVQFILDRKRFTDDSSSGYSFGIERMITEEIYIAAYPLHDGEINVPGSMRHLLYTKWAALFKWYRYQPLDYVKDYFGVKIGLYFAWLGYYTYMLLLASIVGIICFVYSWKTLKYNTPSEEICSVNNDIKMCPLCDHWCDYWELSETCLHARVTYLFDNPTTVLFAVFMSFWATLFLELWKRYSAEITHRWDLTGFDVYEEHPRPQYLARLAHVRTKRINAVTNTEEPLVPFWRMKLPATILSFSVILLLVCLAIVAVLAVVLYRMSVLATLSVYGDEVTTSVAILFTTATAATINLCLIVVFNWMYTYLAEWLTEQELLRTQTEFDDSLTLKIYLLQFVNYYASIFYIAFFKGKFVGYPGNYNRFFNFRQEECGFGGCLMELCIQLGIIMIGKQAVNTVLEMALPVFYRWLNSFKVRIGKERNQSLKSKGQRFVKDLKLVEWGSRGLFPEYLEMVLQYGFVTIFVAAFPLAPFFALLNNVLEMRLDAKKLLTYYRRPVSQRVRDIGIWYRILDSIGKLSVITNGFIIAFTSDFIPKIIYRIAVSSDGSLNGYLNYTLSYFNTTDFQKGSEPFQSQYNVTICRYPDFREPPWSNRPYERTPMYWLIMAARLAFVVIFENVVACVIILVRWCIPNMSQELRDQIRREAYITNEIIIKQETLRARMDRERNAATDEHSKEQLPKSENDTLVQLERIASGNFSGSQLDLFIHNEREAQILDRRKIL
ncbi:anoctamin-1 isoform X2 [Toxorhynchites rutilus septentrionalis]|uniref:anoctamin-1 isoform X2 n=1 Tax=Toxorhynchites rutilus septentrionalis TaxID=329112 RepID=UPI00247A2E47|nr:anoctamin-1 isoform X2 [Toxorhynchites rutilus septentrionalis]